jgi:ribonuclease G
LIQIARKRTSPSLSQILCAPCGRSETRKLFKSKKTLAIEIFRALSNIELNGKWQALEIFTSEPVIETIKNKYAVQLNEFKNRTGCDVKLCIESSFSSDQFNIIPV